MPRLGGWEWVILIALVLLLFGAKRLPDAARGLGRSLRIFKSETKGLVEDGKSETTAPAPSPTVAATEAAAPEKPVSAPERTDT